VFQGVVMKYKVFVDGLDGTTGLEVGDYLSKRSDLELLKADPEKCEDPQERRIWLNQADIAFLCLPDFASRESVSLVTNESTRLIDASTAYRVDPEWTYGLPELNPGQRELIAESKRVSVPGCHATGAILALHPLVSEGIVPKDYPVSITSITGFSGGGRQLIEKYRQLGQSLVSPKPYALGLTHKHIPEIRKCSGLQFPPVFMPIVGNFYRGMAVSIPLAPRLIGGRSASDIHEFLADYYAAERFVRVMPFVLDANTEDGSFNVEGCNNTNRADVFVLGGEDRILLMVRIDNLGKGASGAAVQCLNIMLGLEEGTGLNA
jgi:N-acetyl-gamma-glutamyl-phosphate reductase